MPTALKIKRDGAKKGPGKQGMLLKVLMFTLFVLIIESLIKLVHD